MPYYLHRETPLHNWDVYQYFTGEIRRVGVERRGAHKKTGEIIDLDCEWFSEAQAEADRRNGKQDGGQEVLPI